MTRGEIATALSSSQAASVAEHLAEDIEWNIFKESASHKGKRAVVEFANQILGYFGTVETRFTTTGMIEGADAIAIYGTAEFLKNGNLVNSVNSCDVYEFDESDRVIRINSYCNSARPNTEN
ncbi:MAG: nuclear transport factor 2 family protein [Pyrinomonadaceae bacterium]